MSKDTRARWRHMMPKPTDNSINNHKLADGFIEIGKRFIDMGLSIEHEFDPHATVDFTMDITADISDFNQAIDSTYRVDFEKSMKAVLKSRYMSSEDVVDYLEEPEEEYYVEKFRQYGMDVAYHESVFVHMANPGYVKERMEFEDFVDDYIISIPDFMSRNDFKSIFSNRLREDYKRAMSEVTDDD